MKKLFRALMRGGIASSVALIFLMKSAWGQAAATQTSPGIGKPEIMLTDAEIKAKYRTCPRGFYSGPQPGKARYTKDHYVWAVTPEFAAAFCLPKEFIDVDLKGVEAIAYRMVTSDLEETCGWGGNKEVCSTPTAHKFEIYYSSGFFPKVGEASYYNSAALGSRMLISMSDSEFSSAKSTTRKLQRPGLNSPFRSNMITLAFLGVDKHQAVSHPSIKEYFQGVFERLDYLAIELSAGFSIGSAWVANKDSELGFAIQGPSDKPLHNIIDSADTVATIRIPRRMREAIVANEVAQANKLRNIIEQTVRSAK